MATRERHSLERIVGEMLMADRLLADGKDAPAVAGELGGLRRDASPLATCSAARRHEDAKRLSRTSNARTPPSIAF